MNSLRRSKTFAPALMAGALLGLTAAPAWAEDPVGPADFERFTWAGTVTELGPATTIVFAVDRMYADLHVPAATGRTSVQVAADDNGFVRAVRFRETFHLSAEVDNVCRLLADPGAHNDDWSTPLNAVEAADLDRRVEISEEVQGAISWAVNQDNYVAQYFDHTRHGIPVFLFTGDVAPLWAELGEKIPQDVRFDIQSIDPAALEALRDKIEADRTELLADGIEILDVDVDREMNRVDVGVSDASDDDLWTLHLRYEGAHAYTVPPPLDDRFQSGGSLHLFNRSCDPVSGLEIGQSYLVSIDIARDRPGKPAQHTAVWRLKGENAELIFLRGMDSAEARRFAAADKVEEALTLVGSDIPSTDTAEPVVDTASNWSPWVPLFIGSLVGLALIFKPRLLRKAP